MKKIFILAFLALAALSACSQKTVIGIDEAKAKALDFVNTTLLQGGQAQITNVVDKEDYYEITVNLGEGQEITSGLTKDGEKFFSYVMDIEEETVKAQEAKTASAENQPPAVEAPKSDRPKVELFVMSHCPYGTQIEKGILPVLKEIGNDIDFELKFCDYAMHGKVELDEQLKQVCIQENEPDKLTAYLECFLADQNSGEACLAEVGINKTQLTSCIAATDKEYQVSALFADQSSWKSGRYPQFNVHQADNQAYGITGSPGFVVNGAKIQTGRDANSLLKTICSGFNNPPAGCTAQLSAATPSPGFGFGTAASANTDAGCGS